MPEIRLSTKEAQMLIISKTERSFTLAGIHYLIAEKTKVIGAKKIGGRWYISRTKLLRYLGY